jgi:hypothetical protein
LLQNSYFSRIILAARESLLLSAPCNLGVFGSGNVRVVGLLLGWIIVMFLLVFFFDLLIASGYSYLVGRDAFLKVSFGFITLCCASVFVKENNNMK